MITPALVGVVMLLVLLVGNWLYTLLRYLYYGASAHDVLAILVYRMPEVLLQAIPGAMLLGTALSLNRLERDRELLSLRTAGVTLKRLVLPYLMVGVLAAGGIFWLQETIIPKAAHKAQRLTDKLSQVSPAALVPTDQVFRVENNFIYVREVDPQTKVLHGVVVCRVGPNGYPSWLTIPTAENRNGKWFFQPDPQTGEKPKIYIFNEKGELTQYVEVIGQNNWLNMAQNQDFWGAMFDAPRTPEELTFKQLRELQKSRVSGNNNGYYAGSALTLTPSLMSFYLHRKLAMCLMSLVAILIAIPLSVHFGRSGGYVGLLLSVVVAFCFVVSYQWVRLLAETSRLDPIIAAWAPDAFFGLLGLILLIREE